MPDDPTRVVSRDFGATRVVASDADAGRDAGALGPGTVIKDRFVIDSAIGEGGMGVVYRARDQRKEETGDRDPYVALKVLGDDFRRDQRMVVALQREARKAQTLAHPNIATVYDFDRDDKLVYLTMEVLSGSPLNDVIRENPAGLPRAEALPILRGLCLGLAYAHNKNIVHSDFKPGNIFITADGGTKILDFGIARAAPMNTFGASETTQFDAGELGALTPSYASCEMFEGEDPHPADDVYALAVVAYQLLSGRHPFDYAPAPDAKRDKREPRPLRGLKRREWRAIQHGLAFDRKHRSQHAAEFLKDFEGRPAILATAATILVVLLASGGYIGWNEYQQAVAARPDVPFEALPSTTRAEFTRLLEEGDAFRGFGATASALNLYLQAYHLHARNPEALARIESLVTKLVETTLAGGSPDDARVAAENVRAIIESDAFLSRRETLRNALEALERAR